MPPDAVLRALGRVLRPLVRLLIRTGVTFPLLAEHLRTIYVDVAATDLTAGERTRSDSRISLLTGIHRKELRRQRIEPVDGEPPVVTLNSQILARWLGDPAFAAPDGTPAHLARPEFDRLVASVTRDVRPRSVLDEWLAQGIVLLDPEGQIELRAPAFLPRADAEAKLYYFGRNLHDHLAAAAANVLSAAQAPFLERSVHYDQLSPDAAAELENLAREAAYTVLLAVNRQALAIADADETGPKPRRRVNFGVYVFSEDEPDGVA